MAPLGVPSEASKLAVCLISLLWSGEVVAQKAPPRTAGMAAEMALARDYVLAACLIRRYPNSDLATEADIWASGLIESGRLRAEQYSKLADIARNSAPAPLSSKPGRPMLFESCLKLYNSADLPARIRAVLAER